MCRGIKGLQNHATNNSILLSPSPALPSSYSSFIATPLLLLVGVGASSFGPLTSFVGAFSVGVAVPEEEEVEVLSANRLFFLASNSARVSRVPRSQLSCRGKGLATAGGRGGEEGGRTRSGGSRVLRAEERGLAREEEEGGRKERTNERSCT